MLVSDELVYQQTIKGQFQHSHKSYFYEAINFYEVINYSAPHSYGATQLRYCATENESSSIAISSAIAQQRVSHHLQHPTQLLRNKESSSILDIGYFYILRDGYFQILRDGYIQTLHNVYFQILRDDRFQILQNDFLQILRNGCFQILRNEYFQILRKVGRGDCYKKEWPFQQTSFTDETLTNKRYRAQENKRYRTDNG